MKSGSADISMWIFGKFLKNVLFREVVGLLLIYGSCFMNMIVSFVIRYVIGLGKKHLFI